MDISKQKSISRYYGQDSLTEYFARAFWSLIGNILLFFIALAILKNKNLITLLDLFYWLTVFALIVVRYCEIRYFKVITLKGLPATMDNWRKYVKYLALATTVLWFSAKILGFLKT